MTSTSTLVTVNTPTITTQQSNSKNAIKSLNYQQQSFNQSRYTNNCNKFVPQAFNTNKCQQCFNTKETHSLEALAEFSKVKFIKLQTTFKLIYL